MTAACRPDPRAGRSRSDIRLVALEHRTAELFIAEDEREAYRTLFVLTLELLVASTHALARARDVHLRLADENRRLREEILIVAGVEV